MPRKARGLRARAAPGTQEGCALLGLEGGKLGPLVGGAPDLAVGARGNNHQQTGNRWSYPPELGTDLEPLPSAEKSQQLP